MFISLSKWPEIEVYLTIDRKVSPHKSSINPLRSRYKLLSKHFEQLDFSRQNFNLFLLKLKNEGKAPAYMNNFIKMAKHIDRYYKLGIFEDYSYFREERVKKYEILTPEEIAKLCEVNKKYFRNSEYINVRNKTIVTFLARTGCRINEALSLKWCDFFSSPIPSVTFRETKNGECRQVPIPKELHDMIIALPRTCDQVFDNVTDDKRIVLDIQERAKLAGITKKVWPHLLRHCYITHGLENGISVDDMAVLVGHKNVNSTMLYKNSVLSYYNDVILKHPVNRQSLTMGVVSKLIINFINRLIDRAKFEVSTQESEGVFNLTIRKNQS